MPKDQYTVDERGLKSVACLRRRNTQFTFRIEICVEDCLGHDVLESEDVDVSLEWPA
jgi:hypothetical protein